jgi:hypothetical protein
MKILDAVFNQSAQTFSNPCGFAARAIKDSLSPLKYTTPLTSSSYSSIRVTPEASIALSDIDVGKYSYEKEDFFFSFHVYFGENFLTEQKFLYDVNQGIGFSIKDGNIIFTITDSLDYLHKIYYKLPSMSEAYSIIGSYSEGKMSMYINGELKSSKVLPSSFKFKSTIDLQMDSQVSQSFVILDKIEIYKSMVTANYIREILEQKILVNNINRNIVMDNPVYFEAARETKPISHAMIYGVNKDISTAELSNVYITDSREVKLISGQTSGYIKDYYYFPPVADQNHNQIEWLFNNAGTTLEYSFDDVTYYPAVNNSNVPNFAGGYFYYKVTLASSDTNINDPVFSGISFICYEAKTIGSDNSSGEITTDYNFIVGKRNSSVLYYPSSKGIIPLSGGFRYNSGDVRSVEFMYKPKSLGQTSLIDCSDSRVSWSAAGNVTKSNISSFYVNGINQTSSSISDIFDIDIWYHVLITFSSNKQADLFFNQTQTGTMLGGNSNYSNIAIYSYDASGLAAKHFNNIINNPYIASASDSISVGSDSYNGFNVDVLVHSTQ